MAVTLADNEGLASVTMRAVARTMGTGAASLYRYVSTRDELLDLMVEEVNGEFVLSGSERGSWVDRMVDLAHQARTIYHRHPWMLQALDTTPHLGPNGFAYLEYALAVLASTEADGRTKLEAVGVFSGLVRLLCKQEREQRRATKADPAALADHLAAIASTGSYPHLAAAQAGAAPADDQFDRILRRVLTGLLSSDG